MLTLEKRAAIVAEASRLGCDVNHAALVELRAAVAEERKQNALICDNECGCEDFLCTACIAGNAIRARGDAS